MRPLGASALAMIATAIVIACNGKLDSSSEPVATARFGTIEVPPSTPAPPSATEASPPGNCTWLGAKCESFDPGGPDRWGCWTIGTAPELACEHAAGATIARCNCSGMFGEGGPTIPPDSEAGAPTAIEWFDVEATNKPFSEADVVALWNARCHGRCVPPPRTPLPAGDGG